MRHRLFKLIFVAALGVYVCCSTALAIWMISTVEQVTLPELFLPLLFVGIAAIALSLLAAARISRISTRSLRHFDISRPDERDVEEEIKPLVRRLSDQNKQIRSQMEALDREHKRQDKMRREFTANVSHELKTPLTSISGFAELMRDGLVRPEDVRPFAGKIYDEAQRLIVLVGDIIRLSRLEDQTRPQQKEAVSLYETAERVRNQLLPAADKMQVELVLHGDKGWINAIPQVIEEIIYNLCDNAIKYNRPGGSVTMEIRERSVTVTDTGIGIPEAEQERIFERFYRVDKSHSREVGGTGLGLSIVKHGAACHDAEIHLESHLQVGTTISVSFPKFDYQ